jgi:hypothetical protein
VRAEHSITAEQIISALAARAGDGIWASELAFSGGARRCDFWTISPNGSAGYQAIAYEVKVSRADFRRDSHAKQREARLFSDRFYYATPPGLVAKEEVPDWAGLIEFDGQAWAIRVQAPYLDKSAPTWELVVSLIRNSGEIKRDTGLLKSELAFLKHQVKNVKANLIARGIRPWEVGLHE